MSEHDRKRTTQDSPDDRDLGHLIVQVSRLLRKQRTASLDPFGLSAHQARAFIVVARAEAHAHELRLSGLAGRLRIAPRSATEVVDALEAMGLVTRQPCVTDRRATQLALTSKGHTLRAKLDEARADRSDEFFHMLSGREQSTLRDLLTKVVDASDN